MNGHLILFITVQRNQFLLQMLNDRRSPQNPENRFFFPNICQNWYVELRLNFALEFKRNCCDYLKK